MAGRSSPYPVNVSKGNDDMLLLEFAEKAFPSKGKLEGESKGKSKGDSKCSKGESKGSKGQSHGSKGKSQGSSKGEAKGKVDNAALKAAENEAACLRIRNALNRMVLAPEFETTYRHRYDLTDDDVEVLVRTAKAELGE